MAESLVECVTGNTLVIQKHGREVVRVEKGQVLGSAAGVEEVDQEESDQTQLWALIVEKEP